MLSLHSIHSRRIQGTAPALCRRPGGSQLGAAANTAPAAAAPRALTSLAFLNSIKKGSQTNQSQESRSLTRERHYQDKTMASLGTSCHALAALRFVLDRGQQRGESDVCVGIYFVVTVRVTTTGNRGTPPSTMCCQSKDIAWRPHPVSFHPADKGTSTKTRLVRHPEKCCNEKQ